MKKTLQISNALTLIITIIVNCTASAGLLNGQTIADLSDKYHTLFTPAGYAFSIWGLIYLMLAGFVVYQAIGLFKKVNNNDFVLQIGWWFVLSCIANCTWIITWIYEFTDLSVLMMTILLIALLKIVTNTNMERWDAPFPKILLLWWPFCLYFGWVSVAIIANISAWLTKIGWNGFGISEVTWAIIMIVVAGLINLFMIWSRNMREYAAVGIWALIAIAAANWNIHPEIVWTCGITSAILFINISIHGYQNRATSPYVKWQQMRKS